MTIKEQIEKDFIEAFKSKDQLKTSVLRLLKSSFQNAEIASKKELADNEVISILKREIKQRKESSQEYKKGERGELAEKEEAEAEIISSYLPEQLSDEEISEIVAKMIQELGITELRDTGKVIGAVMSKYPGTIDGASVARETAKLLKKNN